MTNGIMVLFLQLSSYGYIHDSIPQIFTTGMVHQHVQQQRSPAPTCHHLPTISPCYIGVLLLSPSHTQHLVLDEISLCHDVNIITALTLDNGINWAALLAKAAVDALRHVYIVSCRPSATVHTLFCLNCDSLRRADSLAQFASNAALFSCGIPPQSMFSSETWGNRAFLEWIINCITSDASMMSFLRLKRGNIAN